MSIQFHIRKPLPSLEEAMKLHLSRVVGANLTSSPDMATISDPATRNSAGNLVLIFSNLELTEAWKEAQQLEMKWNLEKSCDTDMNRARKAKKAGMSILQYYFLSVLVVICCVLGSPTLSSFRKAFTGWRWGS